MVATPLKRNASRSPEGSRQTKRLLTSSPEEGEVDEANPPLLTTPTPSIAPIPLLPRPSVPPIAKVPFPFKKKADTSKPEASTSNVFERYEGRARENKSRGGKNVIDHWEPNYGRGDSLFSRVESYDNFERNDQGRDGWDARDRRRSPPRGGYPSTRSGSPGSPHYRNHHRMRHSHSPNSFSPSSPHGFEKTREQSRERGYDRDHRERWEGDPRRYRRRDPSGDRHYRPSTPSDYRRDDRDWTRNDRGYDYEPRSRYGYSSRWSASRPGSPNPYTRSVPDTPRPPTTSAQPLSPPPPLDILSRDSGPRPPSSTPPPAPPPDPRLSKPSLPPASQLPTFQSHVKIHPQKPNAPKNVHSPVALEIQSSISTAKAMALGIESRVDNGQLQRPPPPLEPPKDHIPVKREFKVSDHPLIQSLRSKPWTRRTQKEEAQFYGHGFTGCGKQEGYETTTKLGEGTFGFVV